MTLDETVAFNAALAAYPIDWCESWGDYQVKLTERVGIAADHGAKLLVFPEYAAMELASFVVIGESM